MLVMDAVGFDPEYEIFGPFGTWFVAEGYEAKMLAIEMNDKTPVAWAVADVGGKILHREVING